MLVRGCDRQEEKAGGRQVAISAFRDLRVFLEKEGMGAAQSCLQPCRAGTAPSCVNSASLAQLYQDVALQEGKCWPKGMQIT